MRFISAISLFLLACCFIASGQVTRNLEREKPAPPSEKRIALVIGNGAYTKVRTLPNPANDAADMAAELKLLGFEVISGVNQNKRQMETLIREFGIKLANGGTGLFYYAGHGIQVGGGNYLVPVDAEIPEEDEVQYQAVSLDLVLTKMTTAKNDLNIIILDACRNNPFARSWRGFRDAGSNDGLAKISPPTGTLVLYSTEPGKVASDGAGRNGLFTESLLKQIKKPNVEFEAMVKLLAKDIKAKSGNKQSPWKEGLYDGDFYFVRTLKTWQNPNAAQTETPVKLSASPNPTGDKKLTQAERWLQMTFRGDRVALGDETTAEITAHPDNYVAYWLRTSIYDSLQESGRDERDARTVIRLLAAPKTAQEFAARCYVQRFLPTKERETQSSCTKAIELDPNYALAYYYRAGTYSFEERARRIFDFTKAIEIDPNNPNFYISRGFAYISASETETGIKDFFRAIEIDPKRADSYLSLGRYYQGNKDYDQAKSNFDKVIEINPKSFDGYLARAGYYHAREDKLKEDLDFYKAVDLEPRRAAAAYAARAGWNAYGNKPNYDKAITDLTKAIESNPNVGTYLIQRARVYDSKGDFQSSLNDYNRAISQRPNNPFNYLSRGILYFQKLKDNAKAIADFDKFGEMEPTSTSSYIWRANVYVATRDFPRAILEYTRAIETIPNNASLYLGRGNIFQNSTAEYDRAIADYNKAIEIDAKFTLAFINRGNAYTSKKQYDLAIADITKAIELDPKSSWAFICRGVAYDNNKQYDLAIGDYTKAIDLDPKYASAFHNRAVAYYHKQQYDVAITDYTKAIELDSKFALAYRNRANAYDAKGDKASAADDRKKADEIEGKPK